MKGNSSSSMFRQGPYHGWREAFVVAPTLVVDQVRVVVQEGDRREELALLLLTCVEGMSGNIRDGTFSAEVKKDKMFSYKETKKKIKMTL